ncbi:hypothetical protein TNCV_1206401 [Trichonephila clavipes]|nr:hypothetical protein TNCV_1206401 [Trichonephila clavipes]
MARLSCTPTPNYNHHNNGNPAGWRTWFVAGLVRLRLRVRPQPKLVDFHDAENRQWPCRMIMRHVKDPLSASLAWVLSATLNSEEQFRLVRVQVSSAGEKTGCQNYLLLFISIYMVLH